MIRRFRIALHVAMLAALLGALGSCDEARGGRVALHLRFVDDDPQLPLPSRFLFLERVLSKHDFAEGENCPRIWPPPANPLSLQDGGLAPALSWSDSRVFVEFSVEEAIDQFQVVFSGRNKNRPYRGNVTVQWAAAEQSFSSDSSPS